MRIQIVEDGHGNECPRCGAYAGHPDAALDWPNKPKVNDGAGWWWRCYNPACTLGYYNPQTAGVEEPVCAVCGSDEPGPIHNVLGHVVTREVP